MEQADDRCQIIDFPATDPAEPNVSLEARSFGLVEDVDQVSGG
ncbi:hypothetical protein [Amycolatopsis sp. NPDC049868]